MQGHLHFHYILYEVFYQFRFQEKILYPTYSEKESSECHAKISGKKIAYIQETFVILNLIPEHISK